MVDCKSLCHLAILLLSLCLLMVHCSMEPAADQFLDNPTDAKQEPLTMHKRPSFFVGSRYGRSGSGGSSGSAYATSKTRRLNVVPRNDRFFLSSRYGKRAEFSTGTQLSNKPDIYGDSIWENNNNNNQNNNNNENNNHVVPTYMSCVYTGLQNFYRCNSIAIKFSLQNNTPLDNYYYNGFKYDANDGDNEDTNDADVSDEDMHDDGNGNGYGADASDEEMERQQQQHGGGLNAREVLSSGAGHFNEVAARHNDDDVKK